MSLILSPRNRHFLALDVLALLFIPALALTLRLDGLDWWSYCVRALIFFTVVALVVKIPVFCCLGLYRRYWPCAGICDLTRLLIGVGTSATILTALFVAAHDTLMQYHLATYRSVPLIDGLLTGMVLGGFRFGLRGLYHWGQQYRGVIGGRRVLIVGAGSAGTIVANEMRANPQLDMEPVAFVDDDPTKLGMAIEGLPVLGTCAQIHELVDRHHIQRTAVAMPSVPLKQQQEIVALCEETGVTTHNLPGIYELLAGHKTINHLPQIEINKLLHREPVSIDQTEVAAYLDSATVLVTGAGGSIGSELCRQTARFNPAEIILLGHGENSICEIGLDLHISFPALVTRQVIADVRNQKQVSQVIEGFRPDIIFHAAAHKHVPLMETNVEEVITNNVQGTQNVVKAAERHGVERFILISTDKAVNPTSVMGATKRLAELLVVATARRSGRPYMAVRFGNVLGSRGSVVPVFQRQIAAGGPLTITHPDMCRYFMTIPEAVQLVLQAAVLGQGEEVFMLDMGQPVRILDLATDLIKLSGLEPERDIKIVDTGIRPGEKLCEELFLKGEDYQLTGCPKIFIALQESSVEPVILERLVIEIINLAQRTRCQDANEQMRTLLPEVCYYIDNHLPQARPLLPEPVSRKQMVRSATSSTMGIPATATPTS
jgi:FlaA1/EpsC-like NDP-sugar epimerase